MRGTNRDRDKKKNLHISYKRGRERQKEVDIEDQGKSIKAWESKKVQPKIDQER